LFSAFSAGYSEFISLRENKKNDKIWWFGRFVGVPVDYYKSCHSANHAWLPITSHSWGIVRYWSKIANFTYPICIWHPLLKVTPIGNSSRSLASENCRVRGLPHDTDYVMLCSVNLIQYLHVTDRQTPGHSIFCASIALHSKS